jgi:hypothetical protein
VGITETSVDLVLDSTFKKLLCLKDMAQTSCAFLVVSSTREKFSNSG